MLEKIGPEQLKDWLENDQVLLIDVREPWENQNARIEGSILVPLNSVSLDKLSEVGNKKIVVYCKSGRRSEIACQELLDHNFGLEIYNLEGGIDSWMKKGYKVLRAS